MNAILVTDEKLKIVMLNPTFARITRFKPSELIGHKPVMLHSENHHLSFYKQIWKNVRQYGAWTGKVWIRKKSGQILPAQLQVHSVLTAKGTVLYLCHFNFNNPNSYDHLTALPNREKLDDYLEEEMVKAKRNNTRLAVLFVDMDRFGRINESFGYQYGDEILKIVASRLKRSVLERYMVSRIASDDFVIVIPNVQSELDVQRVAEQIIHRISKSFCVHGVELHMTCSIGISMYPVDSDNRRDLIRHAAAAMVRARKKKKHFDKHYHELSMMQVETLADLQLENDLHKAILKDQFILHYQPLFNRNKEIVGTEALIRWKHPEKGVLSPAHFIPLAEESGLILQINEWVLRHACIQNRKWQQDGIKIPVAINLSMLQLKQDNFVTMVKQILHETGLHPSYIILELTESIFAYDREQTFKTLTQLKELGIRLALDDFGTGFSSLSYIKQYPLDILKIDRSFIQDITNEENKDRAIVKTIIHLAHSLNLEVIAEGVETIEQLEYLQEQQCDHFQGFLLGKPQPPQAILQNTTS